MNVLIYLHNQQAPIKANIPDFDASDFASKLNGNMLFINLGGNVISRNLIQMITPDNKVTE